MIIILIFGVLPQLINEHYKLAMNMVDTVLGLGSESILI